MSSTVKKMGLGKGLAALIPPGGFNKEKKEGDSKTVHNILLSKIKPNPKQPRREIEQTKLNELANSIKEHGVIQPVLVSELPEGGYQIVAGERRWRACQMIDKKTIPALITKYSDHQAIEVALIENLQREDLNPLEEARAYQNLIDEFGLTQQKIAEKVGKSRSLVTNMLRLLVLPATILLMLSEGQLSTGHARVLLAINETNTQIAVANEVIKKELSVRQTEQLVKQLINNKQPSESKKGINQEIIDLQEQLQGVFSTKVQIKGASKGKGKVEIEFYNQDDLTRILDIMFHVKH
ncbi:ParB/RepB/Spo0J family partition protein [Peptococcaceae bacterium]|nr:ParB/RepB/Spo0J family partition protein [Peptococcaceae bacterium]